jgi:hypothetical protein
MFVRIGAKPVVILIVQVQMLKMDHDDDEIEKCTTRSVIY